MSVNLAETIQFLNQYDCLKDKASLGVSEKSQIIEALKQVQAKSDYQLFGILADDYEQAIAALKDYATAFEHPVPDSPEKLDGPIYLKYNPGTKLCYCDTYKGEHRGVLVSFQSDFEDGVNEMFGHFPVDLYQ